MVFLMANGYILPSGSTCLWLANKATLTPEQTRIFDTCNATWDKGTEAIFRLLDNKLLDLFETKISKDTTPTISPNLSKIPMSKN
ncbi:MAG: hypothetical protein EDM05_055335 [Leptolyngbya sp. IPPAS B-1204]|nr:MAG: hypothetical protein EDM05_00085 [Leptolyngbya sp. IPPAS B-1204]